MGMEDLDTVVERVGARIVDVRNQYSMVADGAARVGSANAGLRTPRPTTQHDSEQATFLLTVQGRTAPCPS
jgi:hypothetical protein